MRRLAPAILLLLGACTVGPDFVPSGAPPQQHWNDASTRDPQSPVSTGTDPDPQWWDRFGDPVLSALEKNAISGNLDLQQAVLRVVVARANEVTAGAAGLPAIGGSGSYNREQLGLKGLLQSSGAANQLSSQSGFAAGALNKAEQPANIYQYGLNASWELDLFGRVRRSVEQAKASTEAQAEATNDALVMLESEVADAYVQVRAAQTLLASQREDVQVAQAALDLTQRQQRQGLTTELDVDQAQGQLGTYQSQLPGYEKQLQQAMNQLSVLVGQPPGAVDAMLATSAPLPTVPHVVGVGVPATLARRRPDIREAEAQLHAATANVGVAVASFYPDISLTGNAGLRAIDANYLTNWASLFYAFGPSVSLPIFEGGKLTAGLRTARAQQAEAALAYRAAVLNALREVENALVAYRTDQVARDRLAETIRANQQALYLSRDSYQHGLSSFLQVLDAERTLVSSRQQLIQAQVTLTNDVISLYDALGGGWQETEATSNAPTIDNWTPFTAAALDRIPVSEMQP